MKTKTEIKQELDKVKLQLLKAKDKKDYSEIKDMETVILILNWVLQSEKCINPCESERK